MASWQGLVYNPGKNKRKIESLGWQWTDLQQPLFKKRATNASIQERFMAFEEKVALPRNQPNLKRKTLRRTEPFGPDNAPQRLRIGMGTYQEPPSFEQTRLGQLVAAAEELPYGPLEKPMKRIRKRAGPSGPELKFLDSSASVDPVPAIGHIFGSFNKIDDGITESERIGRKAVVKQIGWRYILTLPKAVDTAEPADGDIVRVILFLDRQCNGAAATVTDILKTADFLSFNNLTNKDRFYILKDTTHDLIYPSIAKGSSGSQTTQATMAQHTCVYKDMDTIIEFSGASGTIGKICCNNYGALVIGQNGLASFSSNYRVRFTDT